MSGEASGLLTTLRGVEGHRRALLSDKFDRIGRLMCFEATETASKRSGQKISPTRVALVVGGSEECQGGNWPKPKPLCAGLDLVPASSSTT